MGKFDNYLEKNHEKIFSILEIIISFKFGFVTILVPMILMLIMITSFIYFFRIDTLLIVAVGISEALKFSVAFYIVSFIVYILFLTKFPTYKDNPFNNFNIADILIAIFLFAILVSFMMSNYTLMGPEFYKNVIKIIYSSEFYDNILKLISGLGTFIVAAVAVVSAGQGKEQIKEMKEQRKLQHDPELIAENEFKIYFHNCNEFLHEIIGKDDEYDIKRFEDSIYSWSNSSEKPENYQKMILNEINDPNDEITQFQKLINLETHFEDDFGVKIYNVGNGVAKKNKLQVGV
ncbi:hypothetical protein [Methanococcus maripaludis]|uniref:Uncharacterized protein n=1 Tax=Methanococcus maripaludis TaxID=39152 RepID=A0A7J9SGL7_METMI|nr:hypothetical protein [Methanococcus maripaludis]MBB6497324.1 hypothetical protein [Methanococcus maripaludis]